MRGRDWGLLGAIALGLGIAWVDSRPGWDDTGITVGILLLTCLFLAGASPKRAWQWALAVGLWIPLYEVVSTRNFGAVLALVFAFVGAYLGAGIRRVLFPPPGNA